MRRLLAATLAVLAAGGAAAALAAGTTSAPRVLAAYFADYDAPYSAAEIPAASLTDVIYAFGAVGSGGRCELANPRDDVEEGFPGPAPPRGDPAAGQLGQLALLEASNPRLETEISIGGGGAGSQHLSAAAATAAGRRALVHSCIDLFLRRWPGLFDGIDLDWEFPVAGAPGIPARPSDRADATLLLADFRRALDALGARTRHHYLLTAAMPAFSSRDGSYAPSTSYDLAAVARSLDWINLMTYDLAGASSPVTDLASPLRRSPADPSSPVPSTGDTVEGAVAYYEAAGVPAAKIVIGAPLYGEVFERVAPRGDGLYQHFHGIGAAVPDSAFDPSAPGWHARWSPAAAEPWSYSRRHRALVTYDDAAALAAKARYVLAAHLRGAMVWEISMDTADHTLLDALAGPLLRH